MAHLNLTTAAEWVWIATAAAAAILMILLQMEFGARLPAWQGHLKISLALFLAAVAGFLFVAILGINGSVRFTSAALGAVSGIGLVIRLWQYRRWLAEVLRSEGKR